jgi:hypothetical protein
MANTTKPFSERDGQQTLQASFNDVNSTLEVDGFIVGRVGRRITRTLVNPTTEDYSFFDNTDLLYTIRIVYTDSTRSDLVSVERTV